MIERKEGLKKEGLNKQTKETVDEKNYKVRIQILLKNFSRKRKALL